MPPASIRTWPGEAVSIFFLAIDPALFRKSPGEFESSLDRLVTYARATLPVDPDQPVLVAGDPERAAYRERTKNGIPVADALLGESSDVCKSCHAEFILRGREGYSVPCDNPYGEPVNTDAYGNRVAAMIFGPRKVSIVAGPGRS